MAQDFTLGADEDLLEQPDTFNASIGTSMAGSFGLHIAIVATIILFIWLHTRFHGNNWGQDMTAGAIQASLVSSAPSVPLPSTVPPTKNVLATETPSVAPAIPEKEAAPAPDLKAIAIPTKQPPKPKPLPDKPPQQEQKHPQEPPQQHRANFGEQQAPNMPRSMANAASANNPVAVSGGDFGSRFGWYVNVITRKVSENWYKDMVDPATPQQSQTVVTFTIARDGSPSNFHIAKSSGSPSLDTSAIRAAQRVDSFGPLPPAYNGSSVDVAYTFTYEQAGH